MDKHAVAVLESFLKAKNITMTNCNDWTHLDMVSLAKILRKFYAEVRTKSGELYKKSTLLAMRNGINRHLNNVRRQRDQSPVNLTSDKEFAEANNMLKAMKRVLKEHNKAAIRHFPSLETGDLAKMRKYFKDNVRSNPRVLQQAIFVNCMIYFGRRGRENLRNLKITDFAVTSDADNLMYVYKVTDERTKNHQDDDGSKEARMYQDTGNSFF